MGEPHWWHKERHPRKNLIGGTKRNKPWENSIGCTERDQEKENLIGGTNRDKPWENLIGGTKREKYSTTSLVTQKKTPMGEPHWWHKNRY